MNIQTNNLYSAEINTWMTTNDSKVPATAAMYPVSDWRTFDWSHTNCRQVERVLWRLVPRWRREKNCTRILGARASITSFRGCLCHTHLDAFQMKGLRKILWVSWTANKTNEWVLNKAGVKRELLDTVNAGKLAYYGHTMRKQGRCPEKEIMQGTMSGARRRGRPRTAWMDNINTWTGLYMEESIRMTEDRDK